MRARDQGICQFPGCQSRGFLHLHHIKHWAQGGPTALDNLTLLCSSHHGDVHEGGVRVERDEGGALRFHSPSGTLLSRMPEPVMLVDQPVEALVTLHDEMALPITEEASRPRWDGIIPVDYASAVDWLLELGQSP